MLVLSRLRGERIVVNFGTPNEVVIEVVDVRPHGKIRLGFEAPPHVVIHREEVADEVRRQGRDGRVA